MTNENDEIDGNHEITDRVDVAERFFAGALVHLALEQVVPSDSNPRVSVDKEPFAELKRSIYESGLLQPIVVRAAGERYEIIGGHRRFAAISELAAEHPGDVRFGHIAAMVLDVDDALLPVLQLAENVNRADLAPLEIAAGAARAIKDGADADDVAARLGWNRRQLNRYLQLHEAPAWLKDFAREVKVPKRRLDKSGEPVIDDVTQRASVTIERLPGLAFSHVGELVTAFNVLQQADAERLAAGGDGFKPEAERIVRKLAIAAAVGRWSIGRLRAEAKKAKEPVISPDTSPRQKPVPAVLDVSSNRAVLDLARARLSRGDDREWLAVALTAVLTDVGFRVVVVKT